MFNINIVCPVLNEQEAELPPRVGSCKLFGFDERDSKPARMFEKIFVYSTIAAINIEATNSSDAIQTHFHGCANIEGNVDVRTYTRDNTLVIMVKCAGKCYNSTLSVDITIPQEKIKEIFSDDSMVRIMLGD